MDFLSSIDRALRVFIDKFSRIPDAMRRVADRILDSLRRYTDSIVRITREAARIFGHALWDFLVSCVRICWSAVHVCIIFLVPLNMLGFGMSLVGINESAWLTSLGWLLAAASAAGLLIGLASIPSSFRPPQPKDGTDAKRGPGLGMFLFLDILALAVIGLCLKVRPQYRFGWWPLPWEQRMVVKLSTWSLTGWHYVHALMGNK